MTLKLVIRYANGSIICWDKNGLVADLLGATRADRDKILARCGPETEFRHQPLGKPFKTITAKEL